MFAREVSIHLKPNTLKDFNQIFNSEVVGTLRKQQGFRDVVVLASENKTDVLSISLWDSKDDAEAYNSSVYASVLKTLDRFIDSPPKVQQAVVISSTAHKLTSGSVAA